MSFAWNDILLENASAVVESRDGHVHLVSILRHKDMSGKNGSALTYFRTSAGRVFYLTCIVTVSVPRDNPNERAGPYSRIPRGRCSAQSCRSRSGPCRLDAVAVHGLEDELGISQGRIRG